MDKKEINNNSIELIGVLQAISAVAQKLAKRLISIEEEIQRREGNVYRQ